VGCLVILLGLLWPRVVLFILWVFTNYLSRAFHTFVWPTLGFFFLPTTTLAYAIAQNAFDGVRGVGLFLVILGVLLDFGIIGGGARSRLGRR
jgi:hypothetical protein